MASSLSTPHRPCLRKALSVAAVLEAPAWQLFVDEVAMEGTVALLVFLRRPPGKNYFPDISIC